MSTVSADFEAAEVFQVESVDIVDTAIDSFNGCVTLTSYDIPV